MKITAIKSQVNNENRVSVFVDEKYSLSLTLDQLLEEKLKKDDELDEVRLKELKKLSDEGKLRARALEWLMTRPHSTRELRDYLFKKKTEKELISALVDEFTEKNYLNDQEFARWFTEQRLRKNRSIRAVEVELASKGISRDIVNSIKKGYASEETDQVALDNLIQKLRTRTRYQDEEKLKAYLYSKGFRYDDIKQALAKDN